MFSTWEIAVSESSKIEWTDATWNPVTGCTKVSPGCAHCYAETFAERFRGVPGHPYEPGFDLTLRPERLQQPLAWKRPRVIFVNSMSDLFHKGVPDEYVAEVFDVMRRADWHVFQVLTKRPERVRALADRLPWPDNVWMGVSVENQRWTSRIEELRAAGGGAIPLVRAVARPAAARSAGHRLGDRRRRERARRATDAAVVGAVGAGSVRGGGRAVLLQAVGRARRGGRAPGEEGVGPGARWSDVG